MGAFLLIEDDVGVARSLARILRAHGDVRVVGSVAAAIEAIDAQPWVAIIVDISLPDGSGLDVVEHAREARPTIPTLVLTGSNEPRHINRAAALGARFVCKPCSADELWPFVLDAKSLAARRDSAALDDLVAIAVARWTFSNREAEIFAAALRGTPRAEFLRTSAMSPNTYKSHVRALLRKSDADSLATLALDLLRDATARRAPPSSPPEHDARAVRLATRGDYAAFVRLFPELGVPDPVPTEEDFASRMIPRVLVACDGENVVGYSFWQAYGTTAHVVHVVVAPGKRGRGTGALLLDSVHERAIAEGCVRWYLNVKKDNAVAIRLYERAGMHPEIESVTTRLPWASVDSLGGAESSSTESFAPTATDDAAIATVFGIDRERIALLRARPGHVLVALREKGRDKAIVGFAAFDPSFPGAYPFRIARSELARTLLEALRPHARHPDLVVAVEGDPSLARALVTVGGRVVHEVVRMGAALAAS